MLLRLSTNKQTNPKKSSRMLASPFEVHVAGVSFRDDYPNCVFKISSLMIEKDTPVLARLVREQENPFDDNAIKVVVGGEHIGYIPTAIAGKLAYEIDCGTEWAAIVDRIVMSPIDQNRPGLRLKVINKC